VPPLDLQLASAHARGLDARVAAVQQLDEVRK